MSTIAAYLALNRAFLSRSIAFLSLKMVNFALAASLRSSLSDYGLGKSRGLHRQKYYRILGKSRGLCRLTYYGTKRAK